MQITITVNHLLKVFEVFAWIIFLGLSVEVGALICNTVITLFFNTNGVQHFWDEPKYMAQLITTNDYHFVVIASNMIIVGVLKSIMFYLIIKLLSGKQFNMEQPFSNTLKNFIQNTAILCLGIGIFASYGSKYAISISKQGYPTPDIQALHIGGADVWIFMSIILFLIKLIVHKGIELQKENSLTI